MSLTKSRMTFRFLLIAALTFSAFCSAAHAKQATVILVNGKVWTENPALPIAHAVALDGNTILAVGDDATITQARRPRHKSHRPPRPPSAPRLQRRARSLPRRRLFADLRRTRHSQRPGGVQERIAKFAKTRAPGTWLRNGNWDHQRWNPPNLPNHQLIDEASGDHPALLWRTDGHMALANALALKLAGIDRNTKDPPGGEIERDKDGNPTGILKDSATALVVRVMPPLPAAEVGSSNGSGTPRSRDSRHHQRAESRRYSRRRKPAGSLPRIPEV